MLRKLRALIVLPVIGVVALAMSGCATITPDNGMTLWKSTSANAVLNWAGPCHHDGRCGLFWVRVNVCNHADLWDKSDQNRAKLVCYAATNADATGFGGPLSNSFSSAASVVATQGNTQPCLAYRPDGAGGYWIAADPDTRIGGASGPTVGCVLK
jgi:hypothetical protein